MKRHTTLLAGSALAAGLLFVSAGCGSHGKGRADSYLPAAASPQEQMRKVENDPNIPPPAKAIMIQRIRQGQAGRQARTK